MLPIIGNMLDRVKDGGADDFVIDEIGLFFVGKLFNLFSFALSNV